MGTQDKGRGVNTVSEDAPINVFCFRDKDGGQCGSTVVHRLAWILGLLHFAWYWPSCVSFVQVRKACGVLCIGIANIAPCTDDTAALGVPL